MSEKIPPIAFTWNAADGEHGRMVPRDHRAPDLFEDGKTYRLQIFEGRSRRSHNHEFVVIEEAWKNLPQEQFERFPTPDHFRKFLLIKRGYCDRREIACDTQEAAERVAGAARDLIEYSVAVVQGASVAIYTPQSQSQKTMGKDKFQQSKQDIIEEAAAMIGVSVEDLAKNTGRAA